MTSALATMRVDYDQVKIKDLDTSSNPLLNKRRKKAAAGAKSGSTVCQSQWNTEALQAEIQEKTRTMKEKFICVALDHLQTCSGLYKADVEEVFWIKGQQENHSWTLTRPIKTWYHLCLLPVVEITTSAHCRLICFYLFLCTVSMSFLGLSCL